MKIGLKIWSINHDAFKKLSELYQNKTIDYVELYTFPDSFNAKALSYLLNIPIILHAPTFFHGMNLGDSFSKAEKFIKDIRQYSLFFTTNRIIFHPGVVVQSIKESLKNTIQNITTLKKEFDVILENVPAIGIDNKTILLASGPVDFEKVVKMTRVKTCLDFGHAITSANYINEDPFQYINAFLNNTPYMFHLSDGDFHSHIDSHLDFNKGSFPLKKLTGMIPNNARLSLETPKEDFKHLSEDVLNLKIIKQFLSQNTR